MEYTKYFLKEQEFYLGVILLRLTPGETPASCPSVWSRCLSLFGS